MIQVHVIQIRCSENGKLTIVKNKVVYCLGYFNIFFNFQVHFFLYLMTTRPIVKGCGTQEGGDGIKQFNSDILLYPSHVH